MLCLLALIFLGSSVGACAPAISAPTTYSMENARRGWVQIRVSRGPLSQMGSGFFVEGTATPHAVLTAGHLCVVAGQAPELLIARTPQQEFYVLEVVRVDEAADLCLLSADRSHPYRVRLSPRPPRVDEPVRYYGAPNASFRPLVSPQVRGWYNGRVRIGDVVDADEYTLAVEGGASGAPIVLDDGHLVGVVVSRDLRFPLFSQSPSYDAVRRFLR